MIGIKLDYVGNKVTQLIYGYYLEIIDLLFQRNVLWFSIISQVRYEFTRLLYGSYLEIMELLFQRNVLWFSIISQVQYQFGKEIGRASCRERV